MGLSMDRRAIFLLLLAVQVLSLFSQAASQFAQPPFGMGWHGMGRQNRSCDEVVCGRGSCHSSFSGNESSHSYNFSYSYNGSLCNCTNGWRRVYPLGDFVYRPCVIPNCTVSNCSVELPAIPTEPPKNISDPCGWAYCGKGKCVPTSDYGYRCDCEDGFMNLFNNTAYPCYNECMIDNDECEDVGATLANATAEAPGQDGGDSGSHGAVSYSGLSLGFLLLLVSVALLG